MIIDITDHLAFIITDHRIFIIMENHSCDTYVGRFPAADGATAGRTSTGAVVPLAAAIRQDSASRSTSGRWEDREDDDGLSGTTQGTAAAIGGGISQSSMGAAVARFPPPPVSFSPVP